MFDPTNSGDTPNAISSPGSVSGPMPCVSLDGQTTANAGPAPVPASPSARPAKAKRSTTKGIFGQSGFHSSKHEDLSFVLASKLRPLTDSLGSILFNLTWMTRVTPAGRSISALRASEPLIEGSVFIGWPTPQKHDERERGNTMADHHYFPHDLSNAATLAGWPTTRAEDAESSLQVMAQLAGWKTPTACTPNSLRGQGKEPETREAGGHAVNLQYQVRLAGRKTPCMPNGGRISGNEKDIGKHRGGTKAQISLENEAKLSGWGTPRANDAEKRGQPAPDPRNGLVNEAQLTAFGETPIGYLLGRNGWEIVPASGQLNAAHSRWLMGLPPAWDDCGVTAMESLRKRRKRS
jgi:hypothetical protein